MSHRLEYQLNENDLFQLYSYLYEQSGSHRKLVRKAQLAAFAWPFLALLCVIRGSYALAVFFVLVAATLYALIPLHFRSRILKEYRKLARETADRLCRAPITVELSDEGISLSTSRGSAMVRFAAIDRIEETSDYTYVFVTKRDGYVLPHDRLSRSDIDAFIREVKRRRKAAAEVVV
jgi:hypothetical protein